MDAQNELSQVELFHHAKGANSIIPYLEINFNPYVTIVNERYIFGKNNNLITLVCLLSFWIIHVAMF